MQRLADRSSSRARLAALLLTIVIEAFAILALLRGLAMVSSTEPRGSDGIVAFRAVREPPPPQVERHAEPKPARAVASKPAHVAASAGRQAVARAVAAPVPRIVLSALPAPAMALVGQADTAGASSRGEGPGAGESGTGGGGGGGGAATKAVKLSGDIDSARDYPPGTRELRLGDYVILALGVDTTGAVDDCRIVRASRDAAADAITCRLAHERFRFRPARDALGRVTRSTFGWKQRWFRPGGS